MYESTNIDHVDNSGGFFVVKFMSPLRIGIALHRI